MPSDDIKKLLGEHKDEIKRHFDEKTEETKRHFDEKTEETKCHMDVVAEGLREDIKVVAEGVAVNTERLELLEPMQETLEEVKADVDAIKTTMEGTESEKPLKQRVVDLEVKTES